MTHKVDFCNPEKIAKIGKKRAFNKWILPWW